jgi:hypothetical protein
MKAIVETHSSGYESTDASPRVAVLTAAVLAGGVVLSLLLAAGLYLHAYGPLAADGHAAQQTTFRDGPTQRTSIQTEWNQLQMETRAHLEDYGWVDRSKGVVHIPVARAMDLLVKESSPKTKERAAP